MSPGTHTAPPSLLVVDDEKDLRELIAEGMTLLGAKVHSASDGDEGWAIFQNEKIDLVISDIFMPKMNGIELLNLIKKEHPAMPVLLITGYARKLKLSEECDVPPDMCIEKPFSLHELIMAVSEYLPGRLKMPQANS